MRRCAEFKREREQIQWRVHVNGIRGKSTTTRYVKAIFRDLYCQTYGKTTGSAARILLPDGREESVDRRGFANVNEQIKILRQFIRERAEAIVVECMAVNPVYGEWLEQKVMQSHIGILTNIRLDHTDYLGDNLESIAYALSRSIPNNAILITAEENPRLQEILREQAEARGSKLIIAESGWVSASQLQGFNHFAIEGNVAIGYAIADHLGLSRARALEAMKGADPDPGTLQLVSLEHQQRTIHWANLFAVNDRESFVDLCERLFRIYPQEQRMVILNNRHDRQARVQLFAELAADLNFQTVITFGDFERETNAVLTRRECKVVNCGNQSRWKDASGASLLNTITSLMEPKQSAILIGAVNIHTPQAGRLMKTIEARC